MSDIKNEIDISFLSRMVEYTAPNTSAGAIQELYDISNLLNTGLDRQTLVAAIQCIETGLNIFA